MGARRVAIASATSEPARKTPNRRSAIAWSSRFRAARLAPVTGSMTGGGGGVLAIGTESRDLSVLVDREDAVRVDGGADSKVVTESGLAERATVRRGVE